MDYLVLLGRVIYGGYFLLAGLNHLQHSSMLAGYAGSKGVPAPKAGVILSGLLITAGGLGILLGVCVQWAVLAIALFLIPVTFMMHPFWKATDPQAKMAETIQFKKNCALLGAALMFLAIPQPWMFSL